MSTPRWPLEAGLAIGLGGSAMASAQRMRLLEEVGRLGSISAAARSVGLTYKAAWDAIETLNNLAGEPLIVRAVGGRGGGGSRLSATGENLVGHYRRFADEHAAFMRQLNERAAIGQDDLRRLGRILMTTSARNQYAGTVREIRRGAVNDEILLEIAGGDTITATITQESTENLGLQVGGDVTALIKASWVILAADDEAQPLRVSARNRLRGRVRRLKPGAVNTDVTLALRGGGTLTAIITNDSADELALAEGSPVVAMFKASSVILAVHA